MTVTVVILSRDLLFISRIQSAFQKAGGEAIAVPKASDVRLDSVEAGDVIGCLVDLSGVSAADVQTTLRALHERFPQAQILAFGPHVQKEKLAAAREGYAAAVMTRNQFDRSLPTIVEHWTQPAA